MGQRWLILVLLAASLAIGLPGWSCMGDSLSVACSGGNSSNTGQCDEL